MIILRNLDNFSHSAFYSSDRSSKTEKIFLFHLKSSFRSRDIQLFINFFLPFHAVQIQKGKWKWNN